VLAVKRAALGIRASSIFIISFRTILLPITKFLLWYTFSSSTSRDRTAVFVIRTRDILTIVLVGSVSTILISITSPAGRDAEGIVAAELAGVARLKVADVLVLVRAIFALVAVVTLLVRGDTQPVLATELAQLAGSWHTITIRLVRFVTTIIVSVTFLALGNVNFSVIVFQFATFDIV